MPSNSATIVIDASPDKVFAELDTPETHFAISPSLSEMGEVTRRDGGGHDVGFTMRILGIPLHGIVKITEHTPSTRIAWKMEGDLEGAIAYELTPEGDGCRVTCDAEYENPMPVLKAASDPLISRYNQREINSTLENLKDRLEAV
jgi:carbon monoxide dehydrogenase subunit G